MSRVGIAQEALVLSYKRIEQFRGDASVRTWMISIAWRLSLSRRRRLWWKVNRTSAQETELHALRDVTPSPEAVDAVTKRKLSIEVKATIQQ